VTRKIPEEQCAIVGANIRALRHRRGWSQTKLGELMGWPSASTVCAAEGHRGDRQRGITAGEVERLAAIFGVSPSQLTTRCVNCGGRPPAGFACLTCGAMPGSDLPAASALTHSVQHGHAGEGR
jgi:transcriptional regulator with XRE-family HTH domain